MRQRAAKQEAAPPDDDDEVEQTPVDDEPAEEDEPRQSRADKKRNRYRELQERAEAAERDRAEMAGRITQMQQLYDEARRAPPQQQQRTEQRDELSEKLDSVYREQDLLYRELQARGKTLTQEDISKYEKRARELDEQKHELIADRKLRATGGGRAQQDPGAAVGAFLQMQYSDVYGNPQALSWAQARYQMLKAEGRPAGFEVLQEVMSETRQRYRLPGGQQQQRQAAPPRASQQARYAGAPRGGGAGGGEADEQLSVPRKPEYVRMAKSVYSHIAKQMKGKSQKQIEEVQWKMWVNGPGKRHVTATKEKRAARD